MAFEFIRRKEGEESYKQEVRHRNTQISINDWGHLCIREFDDPKTKIDCAKTDPGEEHLIVFDKVTSDRIMRFAASIYNGRLPF